MPIQRQNFDTFLGCFTKEREKKRFYTLSFSRNFFKYSRYFMLILELGLQVYVRTWYISMILIKRYLLPQNKKFSKCKFSSSMYHYFSLSGEKKAIQSRRKCLFDCSRMYVCSPRNQNVVIIHK